MKPVTKRATLVDVAKAAGVSVSTASVVLNAKTTSIPVSERTRVRIVAAAEALRYEPNALARAFVQQRSNTIGVSIGDPSGYADAEKVRGVKSYFEARGYTLLISSDDAPGDIAATHMKSFLSRRIDGLIVMDAYRHIPDSCFRELSREGVPMVLVEREADDMAIPTVHVADRRGTAMAVAHLVEHGHQHIGFISGPMRAKPIEESLKAYQNAIVAAGIDFDQRYVAAGDWLPSGGYFGVGELLDRGIPLTAVYAANDPMALGAIRAIHDRGLRVPDDIAVMGFDDIPVLAPYAQPGLSTVQNPLFLVGRTAAQMLHRLISGQECPRTVVLPVDLVLRESCGCTYPNGRSSTVCVANGNEARELSERTWIRLDEQVVSVVWGHQFHVQDGKGTSGLGVQFQPAISSLSLSPGDIVSVSGCLTTLGHSRVIRDPYIRVTGRAPAPNPVQVQIPQLCREDAVEGRLGLLIETAGRVVSVYPDTLPGSAVIQGQDGAQIDLLSMESGYYPQVGDSLRVIGILGVNSGGRRSILATRVRLDQTLTQRTG